MFRIVKNTNIFIKGDYVMEYKTFEELVKEEISYMGEYSGYYYIKLKSDDFYDNSMWKVNKKTKEVSYMLFTQFFEIADKAKVIDPVDFKKHFYQK